MIKYKKSLFVILFAILVNYGFSQKLSICNNITPVEDSIILRLLVKYYPNDSIAKKYLVINGKINNIKKYYGYLSFRLALDKNFEVRVINFGTYSEHNNPNFMLVLKYCEDNLEESFVLGRNNLEKDLKQLNNFFSFFFKTEDEKYKLDILYLFLQCKRGVLRTNTFIY